MKNLIKLSLLFLLPLVVISCKKDDEGDPDPGNGTTSTAPFNFIKLGNSNYLDGTYTGGPFPFPISDTVVSLKVSHDLGSGKFKGVLLQHYNTSTFSQLSVPTVIDSIYWVKSDTALYTTDQSFNNANLFTFLKKNPVVNEIYDDPASTTIRKIISTNTTVTTPLGTYSGCVLVREIPADNDSMTYYIHPTQGLVQLDWHENDLVFKIIADNF